MNEKQKILVCGDVEGRFKSLFQRIDAINKKSGPFDMLLCVGNFFGINNIEFDDYKKCLKSVSIPTYILGPNKEDHAHLYPKDVTEFCPNIHYLGKRGVYRSSGGLKIVYLSGAPNPTAKGELNSYEFNKTDVETLRDSCLKGNSNYRGVDILLTSFWPKNITNLDPNNTITQNITGSELISWLASEIKPRYHVAGIEGTFYERPPYRNVSGEIATRFIGMGRVANAQKQKWIYALCLTPVDQTKLSDLYQQTTDETGCPYDYNLLASASNQKNTQFFYNMDAPQTDTDKRKRNNKDFQHRKRAKPEFDQSKCWFCLASPNVEKHLVISVGDVAYLALAKGGLINEHLLILPIEHHQSFLTLPEPVQNEIKKFKDALKEFFGAQDKIPVFFERNYKTSHLQIQVVPVPQQALRELLEIFKEEAEGNGFKLEELPSHNRLDQVIPADAPYFCVELPDKILYTRCKSGFPLQFGRDVLATGPILNIPDRVEWKDCILPRNEEDKLVQKFRKEFESYDFTV